MDERKPADVCLLNMPTVAVYRPSLGLGLLSAQLTRAGLSVRTLYPNVWYAEFGGLDFYSAWDVIRSEDLFGEWIFAAAAFPEHDSDSEAYLEAVYSRNRLLRARQPDKQAFFATALEHRDRAASFLDWVARETLAHEPRIVGCTSVFQQHVASLGLLRRISSLAPEVITMIGGANCEVEMGRVTHESFPWVDVVVSGEADGLIVPLVEALLETGRDVGPETLPAGVFLPRHREQGYPEALPRGSSYQLDEQPFPDYDDFFAELRGSIYASRIQPTLMYETSRGCWWGERQHCTFCGLNGEGMAYRKKSPERVIEEIDHLASRYETNRLAATDNILDMAAWDSLLPMLEAKEHNYRLFFETKSNLSERHVSALSRAGIRWIQPGIESLHTGVLKLMRKGVDAWRNVECLKLCRQYGVAVSWSIICGFPGELDDWYVEMAELIPLLAHLQPGPAHGLRIDRFSPYFWDPEGFGIEIEPAMAYEHVYPMNPSERADMAYFFDRTDPGKMPRRRPGEAIPGRPGLTATIAALEAWREAFAHAELVAERQGGRTVVRDTRPCAVANWHRPDRAELEVLRTLRRPSSLPRLVERLDGALEPSSVESSAEALLERKLVATIDGRLVSLVLEAPVPAIESDYTSILGSVLPRRKLAPDDLRQLVG